LYVYIYSLIHCSIATYLQLVYNEIKDKKKGEMNILLDPNISYLILVGGFLLAFLALFAPGTGLLEIGAVIAIMFSGYFIANLPVNWWALAVLIVGVFPFLYAVRRSKNLIFLVVSIAAFIIGSVFLFKLESGVPAVNPILAAVVSVLVTGLMWIISTKGLEALQLKPYSRHDKIVNQIGIARSNVFHTGTVFIHNEEWSARSSMHIPVGTKVRVINQIGFTLEVEPETANQDLLHE
jgi:membrane-bound serine protease (ClpP class)